jgi:hypothetical protein
VREEHGEGRLGAPHVHDDDLRAPPRGHPPGLHARPPRHPRDHHPPRGRLLRLVRIVARRCSGSRPRSGILRCRLLLVDHPVRRRVGREEGELGGHRGRHPAHVRRRRGLRALAAAALAAFSPAVRGMGFNFKAGMFLEQCSSWKVQRRVSPASGIGGIKGLICAQLGRCRGEIKELKAVT